MASLGSTVDNAVAKTTPAALGGGQKLKSGAKTAGKTAGKGSLMAGKLTAKGAWKIMGSLMTLAIFATVLSSGPHALPMAVLGLFAVGVARTYAF